MTDLPPVRDRTKWKNRPAPWELVTELRIADLVREAEELDQAVHGKAAFATLTEALAEAWHVVAEMKGGPWTWWSGSRVERAWNDIHRAEAAENGTGEVRRCVDGGTASHPWDLALVLLFGALGGLLSVGFALGRVSATKSTLFHPARSQMALKAATGAATALVAVLLLQAELLNVTLQATESAVLAVAVLFGFGQQLLTRFVDQQADAMLGEAQAGQQTQ